MVRDALDKINDLDTDIDLVSGGAAWADHIAVSLFLMNIPCIKSLTIYVPCSFNGECFDNEVRDGGVANYYHRKFSDRLTGENHHTLAGIQRAIDRGATLITVDGGFFARNKLVAESSEYLIAYTFNHGSIPKDGGTKHTWDLCKSKKIHVNLFNL